MLVKDFLLFFISIVLLLALSLIDFALAVDSALTYKKKKFYVFLVISIALVVTCCLILRTVVNIDVQ